MRRSMQTDPMLDMIGRTLILGVLEGFCYALGAFPILLLLFRRK